jgi:hypothetical protein
MQPLVKALLVLCGAEAALAFGPRRLHRQRVYRAAHRRSQETGKPLIVVGAPRAGFVTWLLPTYGCGDLCIDLFGCPTCPEQVKADLAHALRLYPSDSAVVCVVCTLEYVEGIEEAKAQLNRVAGRDLFVARVEPWSLTAFLYPGAQQRLLSVPRGDGRPLRHKRLPWKA